MEAVKKVLLLSAISVILVIAVFGFRRKNQPPQVCFRDRCFFVELARTPEERQNGLMFREWLENDGGMLFVFNETGNRGFWMKNTLIPLDIVWIDENMQIVFISENTQPCLENVECPTVGSEQPARYVLEINGGVAEKARLKIGDRATINF